MRIAMVLSASLLALSATAAVAAPAKMGDTAMGKAWVDHKGMALYTFDKDEAGQSNCYDKCATNWPPLMAKAGDKAEGEWTIVSRTDGTKMWAYEGHPLYLWIKDQKPGEVTGDGVGGVWHLAK